MRNVWELLESIVLGEATPDDRRDAIARRMAVKGDVPSGLKKLDPWKTNPKDYVVQAMQASPDGLTKFEILKQLYALYKPGEMLDKRALTNLAKIFKSPAGGFAARFDLDLFLQSSATQDPNTGKYRLK